MDVDVLKWFADMHNVIFDARWRLNAMHELTQQMIGVTVSATEGASRLSGRDNGSALTAGHSKLRRRRWLSHRCKPDPLERCKGDKRR